MEMGINRGQPPGVYPAMQGGYSNHPEGGYYPPQQMYPRGPLMSPPVQQQGLPYHKPQPQPMYPTQATQGIMQQAPPPQPPPQALGAGQYGAIPNKAGAQVYGGQECYPVMSPPQQQQQQQAQQQQQQAMMQQFSPNGIQTKFFQGQQHHHQSQFPMMYQGQAPTPQQQAMWFQENQAFNNSNRPMPMMSPPGQQGLAPSPQQQPPQPIRHMMMQSRGPVRMSHHMRAHYSQEHGAPYNLHGYRAQRPPARAPYRPPSPGIPYSQALEGGYPEPNSYQRSLHVTTPVYTMANSQPQQRQTTPSTGRQPQPRVSPSMLGPQGVSPSMLGSPRMSPGMAHISPRLPKAPAFEVKVEAPSRSITPATGQPDCLDTSGGLPAGHTEGHMGHMNTTQAVPSTQASQGHTQVVVPFGWRRYVEHGSVVYYSPMLTRLPSPRAVVEYLMTEGTCKCGLSCPLILHKTFNFDPAMTSRPWQPDHDLGEADLKSLCNHKRKLLAMATLQSQTGELPGTTTTTPGPPAAGFHGDPQQAASKVLEALSQAKHDVSRKQKSKSCGLASLHSAGHHGDQEGVCRHPTPEGFSDADRCPPPPPVHDGKLFPRPQNPFEMLLNIRQKAEGGPFVPGANQMFSLQLQAAAARNNGGVRMTSPQHSSPSPGNHTNVSPGPGPSPMGPYRPFMNGTIEEPPTKKKKKKKKKKNVLGSVLDKTMPCPNVDVRQFAQKHVGYHATPPPPQKMASFMDNPTAFLAQQTEMMTTKIQSTFAPPEVPGMCKSPHGKNVIQQPIKEEDTLVGILNQDASLSRANKGDQEARIPQRIDSESSAETGETKDFPASCLLSAAARARFVNPACSDPSPGPSWGQMAPSSRFPSAPIRHVPPGGQHIAGGGSIVYHHNIENQQAFHEGGIVNGGGILMVNGRTDPLVINCMPPGPIMLDKTSQPGTNVIKNLLKTSIQDHHVIPTEPATPIQMVQNLISGIGGGSDVVHQTQHRHAVTATSQEAMLSVMSRQQPSPVAVNTEMTHAQTHPEPTESCSVDPADPPSPSSPAAQTSSSVATSPCSPKPPAETSPLSSSLVTTPSSSSPTDKPEDTEESSAPVDSSQAESAPAAEPSAPSYQTRGTECQVRSSGTLKVKVLLKGSKKKKKKRKGRKWSRGECVLSYVVEPSSQEEPKEEAVEPESEEPVQSEPPAEAPSEAPREAEYPIVDPATTNQLVLAQSQALQHQLLSSTEANPDALGPLCIGTTQPQVAALAAQGQTNIIQTVSLVPNHMVGIDPSTGLVQSIQVDPAAAAAKTAPGPVSPGVCGTTQVVQTVMQSLHIQNNVLMAPGPQFMIPIFPSPAAGMDEYTSTASEFPAPPAEFSTQTSEFQSDEFRPSTSSTRPASSVVSTQTEAVQTEGDPEEMLEGGGLLLQASEEGVLADEDDLNEEYRRQSQYASPRTSEYPPEYRPDAYQPQPTAEEYSPTEEDQEYVGEACHGPSPEPDAEVQASDPVCTEASMDSTKEELTPSRSPRIQHQDSHITTDNTSETLLPIPGEEYLANEKRSTHKTSKESRPLDLLVPEARTLDLLRPEMRQSSYSDASDTDTRCTTFSESMPVLSREGSAKDLSSLDRERPIIPAMVILHKTLEETVRRIQDDDDDLLPTIKPKPPPPQPTPPVQAIRKEYPIRDRDPPKLSVISNCELNNKRPPLLKKNNCRRSKLAKRKGRKVGRGAGALRPGFKKSRRPGLSKGGPQILLNNNKIVDVVPDDVPLPSGGGDTTEHPDPSTPEITTSTTADSKPKSSTSSGGSSDGEANQSSDSSQSNAASEGDEVRSGNSPAIRCSNLLTASPDTNHGDMEGLGAETHLPGTGHTGLYSEGTRQAGRHMKTRRSIRAELDDVMPRKGSKRGYTETETSAQQDHTPEDPPEAASPSSPPLPTTPPPPRHFSTGDLIWGPIKNYPSWPGKIVPYSDVPRSPESEDDKMWVRWFGTHSYSQVEPALLKTLSEGLEDHHSTCLKQRKGRKMNPNLVSAIEEAMSEFDHPHVTPPAPVEPPKPAEVPSPPSPKLSKVSKIVKKKKKLR